jgi:anthranilate synthase
MVDISRHEAQNMFHALPEDSFQVARYHSLYAVKVPACLAVTAHTQPGDVVMAIRHKTKPFAAVQFHPESILTSHDVGLQLLLNQLTYLKY